MPKYDKLFDLTGRVVVVAGGAGAIGGEIARGLAEYGAKIAIADYNREGAVAMAKEMQAAGIEAVGVGVNVLDDASIAEAFAAIESALGPVDALVNTVGTHIEQKAEEVTPKAWDTVVNINLKGAFFLSQAAAKSMIASGKGGSIIHITSVRSNLGIHRGYVPYVASKGGLGIVIKQMATEWAKYQIRVNGIAPTFTRTPLVKDYLEDPNFYNPLVQRIPLGRICETSDLVGIALFLASDASSFITGQNIFVDGGVTACQ